LKGKNVIVVTVSILGSSWHVAETEITSAYRALSKELITAQLGAYVGLGHINITLSGIFTKVYYYSVPFRDETREVAVVSYSTPYAYIIF